MDLSEAPRWLIELLAPRLVGPVVNSFRRLAAGPAEVALRPKEGDSLRVVLTSVPSQPLLAERETKPEFNYLAGPNEIDFAWTLYPILKRLVPLGKQLHPVAFSKHMYIEGAGTVKTANLQMWNSNLLVSGSTKYNDVTRELHSSSSQLGAQLLFPPEGGAIIDKKHRSKRYKTERTNDEVIADYGILAKYWNPYYGGKTIILVAGVESVFQIGITRTLVSQKKARQLVDGLKQKLGGTLPDYFEALIRAPGSGLEFTGSLEVVEAYGLEPPT